MRDRGRRPATRFRPFRFPHRSFQPFAQDDLNEVRPADRHFSSDRIERVCGHGLQRHAGNVSKHQRGTTEDNLQIRARYVRDAIGSAFELFGNGSACHVETVAYD
ncbi:hypothetical protein [Mesorhizobium sp.]|uniref:hypothetical protein n=1 Tax=Mesorhizobium sp. TaxID=1871066 RepID=UPI0025E2A622|nr:hypothetical protein [Mesorhizobium sp.]